ncbi:MAG: dihydrodipicolinate synthase family protein [Rhodopila sp.]|nr:dihydrodipicolinate synthase family protein [Rhodopila sp.]
MSDKFRGVCCAASTPVREDLSVDLDKLAGHCKRLLEDGCHGIALLGSTGEANSFSMAERMSILDGVVRAGVPAERLLPGTGVCALPDTIALTKHALSLGVTRVVMLPPFYYKTLSDQALIDSYSHVFDHVADSRLKVILYHIPPISQIAITDGVIEGLLKKYATTVAGVKDSSGDFEHMKGLAQHFPQLSILAGADPMMKPLLEVGGAGCITATSNIAARYLRTVFDGFAKPDAKDAVEKAQACILAQRTISNHFTQIPTIKAMVGYRYGDASWGRVRHPFIALTEAQRLELGALLGDPAAGFVKARK